MEATPSSSADKSPSSADKSSFWKDKLPWMPATSSSAAKPSSSAAKPSSSFAEPKRYSFLPGFPDRSQFEGCYGPPLPGMSKQYFLRIEIVLCFSTRFNFSTSGRTMPGCRTNSYFFVVLCDTGKEDVLEKYDGRMRTYPQDPHDPSMVLGYLKDGIINLDLARERLHPSVLNPFLLRLGLPPQK